MENEHFKNGVSSIDPFLHDNLKKFFTFFLFFFGSKFNFTDSKHFVNFLLFTINNSIGKLNNWFHDELDKTSV